MAVSRMQIAALTLALTAAAGAQTPPSGGWTAPGVVNQFNRLQHHGDALGFHLGVGDDPALCKHNQGIQRHAATGTPYLFLTRSGNNTISCPFDGDDPGELLVVRLLSRPTDGERVRSNRLQHGASINSTQPPVSDRGVLSINFDGTNGWPNFGHPGGMQLVDDVLVVPMEHRYGVSDGANDGAITFINVADPSSPTHIKTIHFPDQKIGVLAATRDPQTGRYLFLLTGGGFDGGDMLAFYESTTTQLTSSTSLVPVGSWHRDNTDPQTNDSWEEWQMINFVRQSNGDLFLVCTDDTSATEVGAGWARLYRFVRLPGNTYLITFLAERRLKTDDPLMGDLDAGGGMYVSPNGELILYMCEHDNDGPGGTVRMGEFRSINVSDSNPLQAGGWVELYEDHAGWNASGEPGRSFILDHADQSMEDWHNLGLHDSFNDAVHSVRWCLPVGACARLWQHANYTGLHVDLPGTGQVMSFGSLNFVIADLSGTFSSVQIIQGYTPTSAVAHVSAASSIGGVLCLPPGVGSASCPFHTHFGLTLALQAIGACTSGGTIRFEGGGYYVPYPLANPMTLELIDGEGPATIAPPPDLDDFWP